VVAEDPPVEAGQGNVDAGRAQVGDKDVAGIGPEPQLTRWPSARARPDVALGYEAAVDELADPPNDDGSPEPRPLDEVGSGSGPAESDLVEDQHERVERLVRERPGTTDP
jgi:hypothetical protein